MLVRPYLGIQLSPSPVNLSAQSSSGRSLDVSLPTTIVNRFISYLTHGSNPRLRDYFRSRRELYIALFEGRSFAG